MKALARIGTALTLLLIAGALPAMAFDLGQLSAQKRKGCPANYEQTCMSRCMKAGGQPRKCPAYCSKRLRENCAT